MTIEQTATLLKLISNLWPNLKVTESVIGAWHFIFADEEPNEVLAFIRAALKTGHMPGDFPPTPQQIVQGMEESRRPAESPELLFESGPKNTISEDGKKAWQLWGGENKWGALPDFRYCSNTEGALETWRFEKKRFVEIYDSLKKQNNHQRLAISKTEAAAAIEGLKTLGIDFTKKCIA